MSAHPQGAPGQAQGQYDDGYGTAQPQQGQDAYYNDDQYAQYHDQPGGHGQPGYDNQHNDAYYDESCVPPVRERQDIETDIARSAYYDNNGQGNGQYQQQDGYYDDRGQQGYQDEYYSDQYYDQGGAAQAGYAGQNGYGFVLPTLSLIAAIV